MTALTSQTVLVVCEDEARAKDILDRLYAQGIGVVGPASTAGLALALAAQTPPSLALVAQSPTGRRKAEALGQELFERWGVRSLVLRDACPEPAADPLEAPWAAPAGLAETISRLLDDARDDPAPRAA